MRDDDEQLQTSIIFGNGQKLDYEYLEDSECISTITENGEKIYDFDYDVEGNLIQEKNNEIDSFIKYSYDSDNNCDSIEYDDGIRVNKYNKSDNNNKSFGMYIEENGIKKSQESEYYTQNDGEEDTLITKLISDDYYISYINDNDRSLREILKNKEDKIIYSYDVIQLENGDKEIRYDSGEYNYIKIKEDKIVSISDETGIIIEYIYDNLGQLSKVKDKINGILEEIYYDNYGNITQKKVYRYLEDEGCKELLDINNYAYKENWKDLLTSYNDCNITYDEMGNPKKYHSNMELKWSQGRNLSSVEKGDEKISYNYNANGIRTRKVTKNDVIKYILDDEKILKECAKEFDITYIYNGKGDCVGFEYDKNQYYYKKNILNDVMSIMDSDGKIIVTYKYDSFGKILNICGDKEIGEVNPIRYRSYYYDKETGFYYLNNRYYDPEVGRFLNQDTQFDLENTNVGYNLFAYCANDFINYIDLSGNTKIKWDKLGYFDTKQKLFYYSQKVPQKWFGYCDFYDMAAKYLLMDLGTVKVDFVPSKTKTRWRVQLWRGIYGKIGGYKFLAGGEIGLYKQKKNANIRSFYTCATKDKINMEFTLYNGGKKLFKRSGKAWWLNGFKLISNTKKYKNLKMKNIKLTFKSKKMAQSFISKIKSKYTSKKISNLKQMGKKKNMVKFNWN